MNLPTIGQLNRRVKIRVSSHEPDTNLGFSPKAKREIVVWGLLEVVGAGIYFGTKQVESTVTHRVTVRSVPNVTNPSSLKGISDVEIDGIRYLVRRVADLAGQNRFTVLDVEEKEEVHASRRIGGSWL